RKYPNLYGDLSAGSGSNALARDPEHGYEFVDEFQDRLLMGIDICWPRGCKGPFRILEFLREALDEKKISQEAFDKIMGGNAVRLLGLDE
ncbi:MAG: amidohydrolase family protein, partial [Planctomycetes bacterium]|nr:amidohydrolase family protein [Planctomycetota bacterium]